ncbi:MAG: hypothetical protein ACRDXB_00915 [Actinomycetes bacterium]
MSVTTSVRRATDPAVTALAQFLTRWSVPALRVALGLVPAAAAVLLTALMETFIGLTLLAGRFLRVGLLALAVAMVDILSPVALYGGKLFGHGMTLMGQYVLKDVVLVAVVAAVALGARLRRDA